MVNTDYVIGVREALEADKASLEQKVSALTTDKENLTATIGTLTSEKDSLVEAKATLEAEKQTLTEAQKSEEEIAILDIVAKAGGKAWLDTVSQMKSTFHSGNRAFQEHKDHQNEGETKTQKMLREQRERQEAKRNSRKG